MFNLAFEIMILKSRKKKFLIARGMNWHPAKLSEVLNETYKPTDEEWERLAKEVGCEAHEISPRGKPLEVA